MSCTALRSCGSGFNFVEKRLTPTRLNFDPSFFSSSLLAQIIQNRSDTPRCQHRESRTTYSIQDGQNKVSEESQALRRIGGRACRVCRFSRAGRSRAVLLPLASGFAILAVAPLTLQTKRVHIFMCRARHDALKGIVVRRCGRCAKDPGHVLPSQDEDSRSQCPKLFG